MCPHLLTCHYDRFLLQFDFNVVPFCCLTFLAFVVSLLGALFQGSCDLHKCHCCSPLNLFSWLERASLEGAFHSWEQVIIIRGYAWWVRRLWKHSDTNICPRLLYQKRLMSCCVLGCCWAAIFQIPEDVCLWQVCSFLQMNPVTVHDLDVTVFWNELAVNMVNEYFHLHLSLWVVCMKHPILWCWGWLPEQGMILLNFTSSLLSIFSLCWLLAVPKNENPLEGMHVPVNKRVENSGT